MKVQHSVIFLLTTLFAVYCFPADDTKKPIDSKTPDRDIAFVPLEAQKPGFPPGLHPIVDVDAGGFENPFFGNPFPGLFDSIEEMMTRMRNQFNQFLGRIPTRPGDISGIPNFDGIDLNKGNTTSITKVIDGHKVTINETEYQDGSDGSGTFFKVRIIDVHPDSAESSEESGERATNKQNREPIEDTLDNEISKSKEIEEQNFNSIESFDEVDYIPPQKIVEIQKRPYWLESNSVESFEDNNIEAVNNRPFVDLSNDIYVNEILAGNRGQRNPDAEVFEVPVYGREPYYNPDAEHFDARAPARYLEGERIKIVPSPFSSGVEYQPNVPVRYPQVGAVEGIKYQPNVQVTYTQGVPQYEQVRYPQVQGVSQEIQYHPNIPATYSQVEAIPQRVNYQPNVPITYPQVLPGINFPQGVAAPPFFNFPQIKFHPVVSYPNFEERVRWQNTPIQEIPQQVEIPSSTESISPVQAGTSTSEKNEPTRLKVKTSILPAS